jgi:hypothetical protein
MAVSVLDQDLNFVPLGTFHGLDPNFLIPAFCTLGPCFLILLGYSYLVPTMHA